MQNLTPGRILTKVREQRKPFNVTTFDKPLPQPAPPSAEEITAVIEAAEKKKAVPLVAPLVNSPLGLAVLKKLGRPEDCWYVICLQEGSRVAA